MEKLVHLYNVLDKRTDVLYSEAIVKERDQKYFVQQNTTKKTKKRTVKK